VCSSNDSGNADRRVRHRQQRVSLLLGTLDSPLDLTNVIQVLVEANTIGGPQPRLHVAEIAGHEIQQTAVSLHPRQTIIASRTAAEQTLEDGARVDLHRQRCGLRLPTQRVHVGAAESRRAIADETGEVLSRQLD
jgi:hypothetical protein